MGYVRNAWYAAAWSRDVGRSLTRRTVLEENIVLYRKQGGDVAALEDLCPHRFTPLSIGRLKGDQVECGYHGVTFDCNGKCVRVPGQDRIPSGLAVRSYPALENMGLVWLWMGDPALASNTRPFDLAQYHDEARWRAAHGDALRIEANYLNLADNLTDPAHVSFVHQGTLGDESGENVPVTVEKRDDCIVVGRYILDSPPLPIVQKLGTFKGNVDRWHFYYYAPTSVIIDFGAMPAGAGAPQGNRENCFQLFAGHFLTPVDNNVTIDHWLHVRNFRIDEPAITERMHEQLRFAFEEDKRILEAVWKEELRHSERAMVRLAIDGAPVRMRRIVQELLDRESAASTLERAAPVT